ncbi:disks large-associated protein 3-like [Scleropages formosus]|uniref:disks large-associated protein 3-like n=1 Tax=Scleropages formosus TaxID=113540 RepID=UPI0010FAAF03|nr:disks large-associated protein 3-like [Scleropages formosus]
MPIKGQQGGRTQPPGSCRCVSDDCRTPRGRLDYARWPAGGTVPRAHGSQQPFASCHQCPHSSGSSGSFASRKAQLRPPAQMDTFRTLQYHRSACGGQRGESPNRIRHLVHSVQRLFNKSHSLEDPATRFESNCGGPEPQDKRPGGHGGRHRAEGGHSGGGHGPVPHGLRSGRRSRSHDRSKSRESHENGAAASWGSEQHLDRDGSGLVSGRGRQGAMRGYSTLDRELTARISVAPEHSTEMAAWEQSRQSASRGLWTSASASQGRDNCPHALGSKVKEHRCRHLQVPGNTCLGDLAANNAGSEEVPCHRMRSGSYIKAIAEGDGAEPGIPEGGGVTAHREPFRRAVSMDHHSATMCSCSHCSDPFRSVHSLPKNRGPHHMCTCPPPNTQSQAVEALDLPGTFRARSHSYLCAIQAGVSQDDCLPPVSRGGAKATAALLQDRKVPPPLPPRMSKMRLRVAAHIGTASTGSLRLPRPQRSRPQSQSLDEMEGSGVHLHRGCCSPWMGTAWVDTWSQDTSAQSGFLQGPGSKQRSYSTEMLEKVCEPPEMLFLEGLEPLSASLLGRNQTNPRGREDDSVNSGRDGRGCSCRTSIAIQRDTLGTLSDSDTDSKAVREMQSVGIQVEEDRRYLLGEDNRGYLQDQEDRRYLQGRGDGRYRWHEDDGRYHQEQMVRRYFRGEEDRRYIQDQDDRQYIQSESDESFLQDLDDRGFLCSEHEGRFIQDQEGGRCLAGTGDMRCLQKEDDGWYLEKDRRKTLQDSSSLTTGTQTAEDEGLPDQGVEALWDTTLQRTVQDQSYCCQQDAEFYLHLLRLEVQRIEGWCRGMEQEAELSQLPEEVMARIRSAVEDAQLLMSRKVQHFFQLCQKSLEPTATPHRDTRTLAALWELLQLALEEIRLEFLDLQRLRDSGWTVPPDQGERNTPPPLPKKPSGSAAREGPVSASGEWSPEPGEGRPRPEAHETPRAGGRPTALRQNSTRESADGTERYLAEGQTRF